jgi:hypothetical protein
LVAIAVLGTMLFVTIHKYEPKYLASLLLKLSVLTFGGLAVLHRLLLLFGVEF